MVRAIARESRGVAEECGGTHLVGFRVDRERKDHLEAFDYTLLRFSNNEVLEETAAVPQRVRRNLRAGRPSGHWIEKTTCVEC